jgi:hypothetical protein
MTRTLTIIAFLFATPAWAGEKIMKCGGTVYKYEQGRFSDTCYKRRIGRWTKWLSAEAKEWSCTAVGTNKSLVDAFIVDFISETSSYRHNNMPGSDVCIELKTPND